MHKDQPQAGQTWQGIINQDVKLTILKVTPKNDAVVAMVHGDGAHAELSYVLSTFNDYYALQPVRPLSQIARDIWKNWKPVWFGAVPYLDAMGMLDGIDDTFYADTAESVVLYFLGNAATWRGPVAKRIKAELKYICKQAK